MACIERDKKRWVRCGGIEKGEVMKDRKLGKAGWVALCVLFVAGCQGFPGPENASAAPKIAAESAETSRQSAASSSSKPSLRPAAPAPMTVPATAPTDVPPPASLPILQTDAASVASGIVVPPLAEHDSRADALAQEKAQVDLLIGQGGLTREAGAKRMYRFATKNGMIKGKPDEEFWQSLIQAYRNLDDRFITPEDAASDINAAASRRAASLK
jgi:hypothetical protein